jgi:hypothetical protein
MNQEQRLNNEGWQRRFIADEPRLSEAREMYNSLGFEVRFEPVEIDTDDCTECMRSNPDKYKVIYTKAKSDRKRCISRMNTTLP